jgi:EmrB/QacA subfamily drug resistance transporter
MDTFPTKKHIFTVNVLPVRNKGPIEMKQSPNKTSTLKGQWWVLLAVGLGTFMTALDASVVNTILPLVRQTYQTEVANVEWVVVVYLLVLSALLLSFGRLGDMRGHKQVYLAGFGLFVLSSVLCGLSNSVWMLVACRGSQALGGAMLAANSPAILTKTFPPAQRGRVLGLQATMTYLGLTVGPSFGGWLAHWQGWPSVFFINLPVGLAAVVLSWIFIPQDKQENHVEKFDAVGALFFTCGLVMLLLGLNQGHNWGWNSPAILGLLIAAFALLGLFTWIELRIASPMLDLTLFRVPEFSSSTASAVLNYICVYSVTFLMPFYLLQGRGLDSSQAGLILTAQPIIMAIIAPISGALSDRLGARWPGVFGMSVLSAGIFLLSRLDGDSSYLQVIASLGVVGLGTGAFISPNNSALMGSAPRQRQGIAAGVLATARNFGMVLGIGISGAVFNTFLSSSNPGSGNLFTAIRASFLVAVVFALMGIFTTAVRQDRQSIQKI